MKQYLLKINLPPGVTRRPGDLRSLTASLNSSSPALFGRDEDGKTVHHPKAKFVGGAGWVGLLVNQHNEELLRRHAGDVLLMLSQALKQPCAVQFEEHDYALIPTHSPVEFRAREMALKMRGGNNPRANPDVDVPALLKKRLYASIDRACAEAGIDCPDEETLGIDNIEINRSIGMRLVADTGPTKEFVGLMDVSFTLHANLRGIWQVGSLTSRGYGRLQRQAAQRSAAGLSAVSGSAA